MKVYSPMMPDRLAVQAGLAPTSAVTSHWHKDALWLLADLNRLKVSDIYVQCAFPADLICIASMRRWQPDMKVMPVADFIKEASEAVEYLRAMNKREAAQ